MKTMVLALLVVLLCTERVQSLRCYQCMGASPGSSCPHATCPFPDGVCILQELVTSTPESEEMKLENKFCLPACPDMNFQISDTSVPGTVSTRISCCMKDLCNGVGKAVGSAGALVGGLLLSLGVTLLWVPL